jgi:hypothetical protein
MRISPLIAKRLRQLGALVLLGLALALPSVLFVFPVWARHQQLADDVATDRARLGRLLAAIDTERALIKSRETAAAPTEIFLGSGNEAALLAALQSRLVDLANADGVRVLSSTQLPSRDENGFRADGVRLNFRAELEHVQRLLHSIEASRPLMFVEVAELRADWSAAPSGQQTMPVIDAVLDVFAIAGPGDDNKDKIP